MLKKVLVHHHHLFRKLIFSYPAYDFFNLTNLAVTNRLRYCNPESSGHKPLVLPPQDRICLMAQKLDHLHHRNQLSILNKSYFLSSSSPHRNQSSFLSTSSTDRNQSSLHHLLIEINPLFIIYSHTQVLFPLFILFS